MGVCTKVTGSTASSLAMAKSFSLMGPAKKVTSKITYSWATEDQATRPPVGKTRTD